MFNYYIKQVNHSRTSSMHSFLGVCRTSFSVSRGIGVQQLGNFCISLGIRLFLWICQLGPSCTKRSSNTFLVNPLEPWTPTDLDHVCYFLQIHHLLSCKHPLQHWTEVSNPIVRAGARFSNNLPTPQHSCFLSQVDTICFTQRYTSEMSAPHRKAFARQNTMS